MICYFQFILFTFKYIKQHKNRMSDQTEALISWLSKTLHKPEINNAQQLRDGLLLQQICNKIPGIKFQIQNIYQGWKNSYIRLTKIYKEIQLYMKETLKHTFTSGISTINTVDISKGEDDQGLISLLKLIFIICLNSSDRQIFVQKIITLSQQNQQQLMQIIQDNQLPDANQNNQLEQFQEKYQRERQKLKQLVNAYQNISLQNQSLKQALITQAEEQKRLAEQVKKLCEQKQKLSKEVLQFYKKKESEQNSQKNLIISEHNQVMMEQLKNSLLQQEQTYSQQIYQLKSQNQDLKEQLDMCKMKIQELQQSSNTFAVTDHSKCINRSAYQKQIKQLNSKFTQMSSKQWKGRLQNIRLTNLNEQIKAKNKKLVQENSKAKQNGFMIGKQDSNKLKIQFYSKLRDSLKSKLQGALLQKKSIKNIQKQQLQQQDNKNNILQDL